MTEQNGPEALDENSERRPRSRNPERTRRNGLDQARWIMQEFPGDPRSPRSAINTGVLMGATAPEIADATGLAPDVVEPIYIELTQRYAEEGIL